MKEALAQVDDEDLDRIAAIIRSMTPQERRDPKILNGSRRLRIAKGSGVTVTEVNNLVDRFFEARKMMKQMAGGMPGMPGSLPGAAAPLGPRGKRGKRGRARGGGAPPGTPPRPGGPPPPHHPPNPPPPVPRPHYPWLPRGGRPPSLWGWGARPPPPPPPSGGPPPARRGRRGPPAGPPGGPPPSNERPRRVRTRRPPRTPTREPVAHPSPYDWSTKNLVATKIKLMRLGKMRAPYYRIVVADARTKRDGRVDRDDRQVPPQGGPLLHRGRRRSRAPTGSVSARSRPSRSQKILSKTGDWQKFKGEPAPRAAAGPPPRRPTRRSSSRPPRQGAARPRAGRQRRRRRRPLPRRRGCR